MSGFLGGSRILKYTRNSEKRQAEHELLVQSTPTNETHEDSNRKLESEVRKAEHEVRIPVSGLDITLISCRSRARGSLRTNTAFAS